MSAPRWHIIARKYLGTREIVGAKHSPVIIGWAKKLGAKVLGIAVNDDETPWCGTFMAEVVTEAGLTPPKIAVRANSWSTWGVPLKVAVPGAFLVFKRPGGYHIAQYVKENASAYCVIGGNQSNAVTDSCWIAKANCVAIRWPAGEPLPTTGPVKVSASGVPLSRNQA